LAETAKIIMDIVLWHFYMNVLLIGLTPRELLFCKLITIVVR